MAASSWSNTSLACSSVRRSAPLRDVAHPPVSKATFRRNFELVEPIAVVTNVNLIGPDQVAADDDAAGLLPGPDREAGCSEGRSEGENTGCSLYGSGGPCLTHAERVVEAPVEDALARRDQHPETRVGYRASRPGRGVR
jgi:hypothetical protein